MAHQSSCPHTPQQNGVAERKHHHHLDASCILLLQANVPSKFWADAVLTASYLINYMPSYVLNNQIPYSILFPDKPPYKPSPCVFGCACFVHDLSPGKDQLCPCASKYILL